MWDRETGALVADLTGGHTGRIFCVGFDFKKVLIDRFSPSLTLLTMFSFKIVSCGDDQVGSSFLY